MLTENALNQNPSQNSAILIIEAHISFLAMNIIGITDLAKIKTT